MPRKKKTEEVAVEEATKATEETTEAPEATVEDENKAQEDNTQAATDEDAKEGDTPPEDEKKTIPEPEIEFSKVKYKRGNGAVELPKKVRIPANLARSCGVARDVILTKDSELPTPIYEWLRSDYRYMAWFTKGG